MDYKICKRLKDAGFPQKKIEAGDDVFVDENSKQQWNENIGVVNIIKEAIRIPTLSELIDACGDGFDSLERYSSGKRWRCVKWIKHIYKCDDGKSRYGCLWKGKTWGFTPEEAVANLYLALHEKHG